MKYISFPDEHKFRLKKNMSLFVLILSYDEYLLQNFYLHTCLGCTKLGRQHTYIIPNTNFLGKDDVNKYIIVKTQHRFNLT